MFTPDANVAPRVPVVQGVDAAYAALQGHVISVTLAARARAAGDPRTPLECALRVMDGDACLGTWTPAAEHEFMRLLTAPARVAFLTQLSDHVAARTVEFIAARPGVEFVQVGEGWPRGPSADLAPLPAPQGCGEP
jgi:hypothetical protein